MNLQDVKMSIVQKITQVKNKKDILGIIQNEILENGFEIKFDFYESMNGVVYYSVNIKKGSEEFFEKFPFNNEVWGSFENQNKKIFEMKLILLINLLQIELITNDENEEEINVETETIKTLRTFDGRKLLVDIENNKRNGIVEEIEEKEDNQKENDYNEIKRIENNHYKQEEKEVYSNEELHDYNANRFLFCEDEEDFKEVVVELRNELYKYLGGQGGRSWINITKKFNSNLFEEHITKVFRFLVKNNLTDRRTVDDILNNRIKIKNKDCFEIGINKENLEFLRALLDESFKGITTNEEIIDRYSLLSRNWKKIFRHRDDFIERSSETGKVILGEFLK